MRLKYAVSASLQAVSCKCVGRDGTASPMEIRMSGFLYGKKGYQSNNGGFQLIFHLNMQKVKISKCVAYSIYSTETTTLLTS